MRPALIVPLTDEVPPQSDIHRALVLRDGSTVELRPLLVSDEDAYRTFTETVSPEAQYYRFFSHRARLTESEIDRFLHVNQVDRVAFIACRDGEVLAVARYDRDEEHSTSAEVAFIVHDRIQGHGIAPALLDVLAEVAAANGITELSASVLPDNHKMLRVFEKSGRLVGRRYADGAIQVVLAVGPPPPAPA